MAWWLNGTKPLPELVEGKRPLIEKDLEKDSRDLKQLMCQVPFNVAF